MIIFSDYFLVKHLTNRGFLHNRAIAIKLCPKFCSQHVRIGETMAKLVCGSWSFTLIQDHCKACHVLPVVYSELRSSSPDRLFKNNFQVSSITHFNNLTQIGYKTSNKQENILSVTTRAVKTKTYEVAFILLITESVDTVCITYLYMQIASYTFLTFQRKHRKVKSNIQF